MEGQIEKSSKVIFVEDSESARIAVKEIIEKKTGDQIKSFEKGFEFFEYLNQMTESICLPELVLVSLSLPDKGGYELISQLKHHDVYKFIPIVALSSSHDPSDVMECFKLHVNGYIYKSREDDEFKLDLENTLDFWLNAAQRL